MSESTVIVEIGLSYHNKSLPEGRGLGQDILPNQKKKVPLQWYLYDDLGLPWPFQTRLVKRTRLGLLSCIHMLHMYQCWTSM